MKRHNIITNAPSSLARTVWANLLRFQYLRGLSDAQICEMLGITARTFTNYRSDPSNITLRQLQDVLDGIGVKAEDLFREN